MTVAFFFNAHGAKLDSEHQLLLGKAKTLDVSVKQMQLQKSLIFQTQVEIMENFLEQLNREIKMQSWSFTRFFIYKKLDFWG